MNLGDGFPSVFDAEGVIDTFSGFRSATTGDGFASVFDAEGINDPVSTTGRIAAGATSSSGAVSVSTETHSATPAYVFELNLSMFNSRADLDVRGGRTCMSGGGGYPRKHAARLGSVRAEAVLGGDPTAGF